MDSVAPRRRPYSSRTVRIIEHGKNRRTFFSLLSKKKKEIDYNIGEEATYALAGFTAGLLSFRNWDLEMLSLWNEKTSSARITRGSKVGTSEQQTQPKYSYIYM